jgi:hypothetical protein
MALKAEMPRAAPICDAAFARPAAMPALSKGIAAAITMVDGVKLRATPAAARSRPGRTPVR